MHIRDDACICLEQFVAMDWLTGNAMNQKRRDQLMSRPVFLGAIFPSACRKTPLIFIGPINPVTPQCCTPSEEGGNFMEGWGAP